MAGAERDDGAGAGGGGGVTMRSVLEAVYRHGQGFAVDGSPLPRADAAAVRANWEAVRRLMETALPGGPPGPLRGGPEGDGDRP